jgi:hypothetical protein
MIDIEVVRQYLLKNGHYVSRRTVRDILVDLGFPVGMAEVETAAAAAAPKYNEVDQSIPLSPKESDARLFESPRILGPAKELNIDSPNPQTIFSLVEKIESLETILFQITVLQENQRKRFYSSQQDKKCLQQGVKEEGFDAYSTLQKNKSAANTDIKRVKYGSSRRRDYSASRFTLSDDRKSAYHAVISKDKNSGKSLIPLSNTDPVDRYRYVKEFN